MGGLPSVLPRLRRDRIIARTRKTSSLYSRRSSEKAAFSRVLRASGEKRDRALPSCVPQLREEASRFPSRRVRFLFIPAFALQDNARGRVRVTRS